MSGAYAVPASGGSIALRAAWYRVASIGWNTVEFFGDFALLAEVRLRAIVYRVPALLKAAGKPAVWVRGSGALVTMFSVISLLVMPAAQMAVPAGAALEYISAPGDAQEVLPDDSHVLQYSGGDDSQIIEIAGSVSAPTAYFPDDSAAVQPLPEADAASSAADGVDDAAVTKGLSTILSGIGIEDARILKSGRPAGSAIHANSAAAEDAMPDKFSAVSVSGYVWPAHNEVTSPYGRRAATVGSRNHKGIDICGNKGDPIYAVAAGEVISSGYEDSFGNVIRIEHSNGYVSLYAHCSSLLVKIGEQVTQGQRIAKMGETGLATGVHLHFEIIRNSQNVDPLPFLP